MVFRGYRGRACTGVALVLGVAVPLLIFVWLALEASGERAPAWDRRLVRLADRLYDAPGLVISAKVAVYSGIVVGIVLAVAVLGWLIASGRRSDALFWGLSMAGVVALDLVLKSAFERPSLGESDDYSFPSGNAMAVVAFVTAAATLAPPGRHRRRVASIGVAVAFVYGVALVLLLWHYPSDVVAGWCIALAWVTVLGLAARPLRTRSAPPVPPRARAPRPSTDRGVRAPRRG